MLGGSDAAWKHFGNTTPYYGVLTQERFRDEALDEHRRRSFFDTGEAYVRELFGELDRFLNTPFAPAVALDFGCGVGRLLLPMARRCEKVIGVDVAEGMLAEARKNCAAQGLANVDFRISDDDLCRVTETLDFVHSFIVFQHIPPRRGMRILSALVRRLRPGGVGALHFTYHRPVSRLRTSLQWLRAHVPFLNNFANLLLRRAWSTPLMEMNAYELNEICLLLQKESCTKVGLRFTNHAGYLGAMVLLQKRESATGSDGSFV
jgi:SAM-dependent methyltransferase